MQNRATLEIQRLAGDRAVVPFESLDHPDAAVEVGSLYVDDQEGNLLLLRPYLMRTHCPRCHSLSTFHVDRFRGGVVWLKSLEDGHAMSNEETKPFEQIGYL